LYVPDEASSRVLVIGTENYTVQSQVIDVRTGRVTATRPVGADPFAVVVSPDGRRAYVSDAGSDSVTVINIAG
jgi:DNA-binding beta-propeller fold protein YncE